MCYAGDAPQTGMGRTTEFSRLGLLRMQLGLQLCGSAHRPIAGRDGKSLRTAARQGVHKSCLLRTSEALTSWAIKGHLPGLASAMEPCWPILECELSYRRRLSKWIRFHNKRGIRPYGSKEMPVRVKSLTGWWIAPLRMAQPLHPEW